MTEYFIETIYRLMRPAFTINRERITLFEISNQTLENLETLFSNEEDKRFILKSIEKLFTYCPNCFIKYIETIKDEHPDQRVRESKHVFFLIPKIIEIPEDLERLKYEVNISHSNIKSVSNVLSPQWVGKGSMIFGIISNISVKTVIVKARLRKTIKSTSKKDLEIARREGWRKVEEDAFEGIAVFEKEYSYLYNEKMTEMKGYEILDKTEATLVEGEVIDDTFLSNSSSLVPLKFRYITTNFYHDNIKRYMNTGMRVKLIGILRTFYSGKENTGQYIYETLGIEPVELEESSYTLSPEEEEKLEKMISDNKLLDFIDKTLAPNIKKRKWEKFAVVLQAVGPNKISENKRKNKNAIHILFFGNPETGKTQIALDIERIFPMSKILSSTSITEAGLVGSLQQTKNGFFSFVPGDLIMMNNGLLILDEFDKTKSKDISNSLHTAMDPGFISLSKANIKIKTPISTSILAIANPKKGELGYMGNTIEEDLAEVFDSTILTRFDLIFIFNDDNLTKEELLEIIDSYLDEKDEEEEKGVEEDRMLLRKLIFLAKNRKVEFSKDAREYLRKLMEEMLNDSKFGKRFLKRKMIGFKNIIEAIAKLHLRDKITVDDVKLAYELYEYALSNFNLSETIEVSGVPEEKVIKTQAVYEAMEEYVEENDGKINLMTIKYNDKFRTILKDKLEKYKIETRTETILKNLNDYIDLMEEKDLIRIERNKIEFIEEPLSLIPKERLEEIKKRFKSDELEESKSKKPPPE